MSRVKEGRHYQRRQEWSERQEQVFDLLVKNYTNREIAETLGISLDGAKYHVSELITRLGVETREQAADYWRQQKSIRARFRSAARALSAPLALRWVAAAGGAVLLAGIVAVIAVLLLQGGDGQDAAAPDVTPTPVATEPADTVTATPDDRDGDEPARIELDDDGFPLGAAGPILVYAEPPDERGSAYRVFLYDAGRHEHLGWLELGGVPPQLAGKEYVVLTEDELVAYQLDGSRSRTVASTEEDSLFYGMSPAVSPDGRFVAVLIIAEDGPDFLAITRVIEIETGQTVIEVTSPLQSRENEGWFGWPMPCCWSADSSVLLMRGNTESEAPGTLGYLALDGELHASGVHAFGLIDPTRERVAAMDPGAMMIGGPMPELRIVELDDGSEQVVHAGEEELLLLPYEWSPDGSALLYRVNEPDGDDWRLREVRMLDLATGEDSLAPPVNDLRAEWYGDRAIGFVCDDGSEPTGMLDWFGTRTGVGCAEGDTTVVVDGVEVDQVPHPTILGWVERED